jgi:hypothetical protein
MSQKNLRRSLRRVIRTVLGLASMVPLLASCGGDGGGTPICMTSTTPQEASTFCAPTRIAANQGLRLQIREQCGGCTQRATRCEVTVSGSDVKLSLLGDTCTLPGNYACPAICSVSTFDCNVPALAPGTYRVFTPAGTTTSVMMTTDIAVSATSCTLPTP